MRSLSETLSSLRMALGVGEDTSDEDEVAEQDAEFEESVADAVEAAEPVADEGTEPTGSDVVPLAAADRGDVVRWAGGWHHDRLLDGYESRELALVGARRYPEEGELEPTATLVRRSRPRHARAVLYVHGWNDYFFQRHLAEHWDDLGYDFYALDLRRYGRSLHTGQLPGYVEDLSEYDLELDAAVERVRRHHSVIVVNGHSTGGLITALWADRHPGVIAGLVLNSPWIDLQGSALVRALAPPLVRSLATRAATWALPMGDSGFYSRALHVSHGGEWDWDLDLKRSPSQPVRSGWLRAIMNGHDQVSGGLAIDCPVLMMVSARSDFGRKWSEELKHADIVLDVNRLAAKAPNLGRHVTLVRIDNAVHDIVLSGADVRAEFFDELQRWEGAYLH